MARLENPPFFNILCNGTLVRRPFKKSINISAAPEATGRYAEGERKLMSATRLYYVVFLGCRKEPEAMRKQTGSNCKIFAKPLRNAATSQRKALKYSFIFPCEPLYFQLFAYHLESH